MSGVREITRRKKKQEKREAVNCDHTLLCSVSQTAFHVLNFFRTHHIGYADVEL